LTEEEQGGDGTRVEFVVSTLVVTRLRAVVVPIGASALLIATVVLIIEMPVLPARLIDQCGNSGEFRPSAPIVVVGVLSADTLVSRPVPMHSDPEYPLQLRRLTVQVENVLKGRSLPDTIIVYYFTFAGGFDGPRPLGLWRVGGRRVLWLRTDSGVYRTVCDGWDDCTMRVESGAHRGYRPDPQKPLDYALTDLLLTRGEGAINENRFASQILSGVPDQGLQGYTVEKLRHLALTEQGEVKASACTLLWIYAVDRIDVRICQDAGRALKEANCRCSTKPDNNVECR
jgi:hypothetical protein